MWKFRRLLPDDVLRLNIEDVLIHVWLLLRFFYKACQVLSLFCDTGNNIEVAVIFKFLALVSTWLFRFALQGQSH